MGECFLHGNNAPVAGIPVFTYTGEHRVTDEGNKNWNIQFLTSGVLKLSQRRGAAKGVEVFLVGGGNNGNNAGSGSGGRGGNGGECKTESARLSFGVEYPITIGAGSEATTCFGHTAAAGGGSSGGGGGLAGEPSPNGRDGSDGTHAFNDTSYARYGAGGGGGAGFWGEGHGRGGNGGNDGAGDGGTNNGRGKDAVANTGGGGGGGSWSGGKGGTGGSGIVIIRNKR